MTDVRLADPAPASPDPRLRTARAVLESGYTLRAGVLTEFGAAFGKSLQIVAEQPGFQCVVGSAILNSEWLYFYGSWDNLELMDQWYWHRRHKPLQDGGFGKWFDRMYMRKWRELVEGEQADGTVFCQTELCTGRPLADAQLSHLQNDLRTQFADHCPAPFETLTGEFEADPFQLAGPVTEFPDPATSKYLIITHWAAAHDAQSWLDSAAYTRLADLGEVSTAMCVPAPDAPGTRPGLRADGLQRDWTTEAGPWRSPRKSEVPVEG